MLVDNTGATNTQSRIKACLGACHLLQNWVGPLFSSLWLNNIVDDGRDRDREVEGSSLTHCHAVAPERIWTCWGHRSGSRHRKFLFLAVTLHFFGSKSTTSRFGERFRAGQYSLVSFLFAVLLLTVPPPVPSHL